MDVNSTKAAWIQFVLASFLLGNRVEAVELREAPPDQAIRILVADAPLGGLGAGEVKGNLDVSGGFCVEGRHVTLFSSVWQIQLFRLSPLSAAARATFWWSSGPSRTLSFPEKVLGLDIVFLARKKIFVDGPLEFGLKAVYVSCLKSGDRIRAAVGYPSVKTPYGIVEFNCCGISFVCHHGLVHRHKE